MAGPGDGRGVLYPARLPTFHREPAAAAIADVVRWFWVPRWRLPPGTTSRQEVLAFPASNLVVEPGGVVRVSDDVALLSGLQSVGTIAGQSEMSNWCAICGGRRLTARERPSGGAWCARAQPA